MEREVLSLARGHLIKAVPWLATAFGRLTGKPKHPLPLSGTDGARFWYDPLIARKSSRRMAYELAHATAHCLLGHLWMGRIDALEADMAVALLLDELIGDLCPFHGDGLFRQARHRLSGVALGRVGPAMARDEFFAANREALLGLLHPDDHGLWRPDEAPLHRQGASGEGWESLRRVLSARAHSLRIGRSPGDATLRYKPGIAVNHRYRELLARYAREREVPQEDLDSFDRNLYLYGLERYGNMPIVEPSETRQARVIQELAIVIDTSASCLETLTARFLDQTRSLLADPSLFPRRFNLWLLQCDARVQREDHITSVGDFERYVDALELVGGGGTDFGCAFERIDRLIALGAFRRLPLALFFSDGMGLFPPSPPSYDTAFVFFEGRYDDIDVPHWAHKLILEDSTIEHP